MADPVTGGELGPTGGPLDARTLMTSFAARGVVCTVLAPNAAEDATTETLRASRRADIVILDWQLGDEGDRATSIISDLIEDDAKVGGRLRLVVVYTAEPNLNTISASVNDDLDGFSQLERPGNVLALAKDQTRILFIRKGRSSAISGGIEERDLADRLIDEFVEIGKGLLGNVALACVAAIRDDTHRMLARFHRELDGPYVTHRLLLEWPEDAEDYAVDLVASEFLAVLDGQMIGSAYAGRDALQAALNEREGEGVEFRLMTRTDSEEGSRIVSVSDIMNLIDEGPLGLAAIPDVASGAESQKKLHKRLYLLLSDDLERGVAAHREFARVSAHAREPRSVAPSYRAKLGLGSIVQRGGEYLICIQPACDAVRLTELTQFLFVPLSRDTSIFDIVTRDTAGDEICLKVSAKPSHITTISFRPDLATRTVVSEADGGVWMFESESGEQFIWVGDLKTSFAQRLAHRVARNLSRIGLDEFEWQRRHGPGG